MTAGGQARATERLAFTPEPVTFSESWCSNLVLYPTLPLLLQVESHISLCIPLACCGCSPPGPLLSLLLYVLPLDNGVVIIRSLGY